MPEVYAAEGGRDYLIRVVLYGVQGEISAGGRTFNGSMPAFAVLSDEEIAAVLNHELTSWGNDELLPDDFAPIEPSEVAELRGEDLTPRDTYEQRASLGLDGGAAGAAAGSVLDGVYTEAQAERGRAPYAEHCARCHGGELGGGEGVPSLTGGLFMLHWANKSVADLFEYTRSQMPLGQPGSLSDSAYLDIIALIFQANGFPPGETELGADREALQQIMIERRR